MRLACIVLAALALAPAAQEGTSPGEIVFVGVHVTRASGVLAFNADGTHQTRLVTGGISNLVVAPDGAIAYSQVDVKQNTETVVLSGRNGPRAIGRGRVQGFSPDGAMLAIVAPDTSLELYDRGSGLVRTTLPPVDHFLGWAGGSLLYEAGLADRNELHLLGATDRTLVSINGPILAAGSPDGRWIAYTTPDGLHIVDAGGSGAQGPVSSCSGWVAWSRDSTRVACVTYNSLAFAGVDGTVETIAAPAATGAWPGTWSPNGAQFAFTTNDGVGIADLRSASVRELAHGGRLPQWSPDGRTLAVAYGEGINTAVVPASGGALRVVARDASPAWLPDGRLLAVVSERDENEAATMLPSGRALHLIAHTAGAIHPELSPDRSKLVYETLKDGPTPVFVCNADGTHRLLLTRVGSGVTDVAWSPDGRRIAYVDDRGIKLIAPSGGPGHLVPHTGGAANVAWSPDGTQLGYAVYGGTTEIDVIDTDGRHRHVVVGKRRPLWTDSGIAWSPDGTHIAFALDVPVGNGEDMPSLAIVNVHSRSITDLGVEEQNPAWSPDGKTLATDYYGGEIHLIDVAKPGHEITLAHGSDPSWSR